MSFEDANAIFRRLATNSKMRADGSTAIFLADVVADGVDEVRATMATLEIPWPGQRATTSAAEKQHYGVTRPEAEVIWLRDEWIAEG